MKKITTATFKSFITKNIDKGVYVGVKAVFDGMTDAVEYKDSPDYFKINKNDLNFNIRNTYGINGIWLVHGSRDYFSHFENEGMIGIQVYNSCGTFFIFILK